MSAPEKVAIEAANKQLHSMFKQLQDQEREFKDTLEDREQEVFRCIGRTEWEWAILPFRFMFHAVFNFFLGCAVTQSTTGPGSSTVWSESC